MKSCIERLFNNVETNGEQISLPKGGKSFFTFLWFLILKIVVVYVRQSGIGYNFPILEKHWTKQNKK